MNPINFTKVNINGLSLLFPKDDVQKVEPISGIPIDEIGFATGINEYQKRLLPIHVINSEFALIDRTSEQQQFVAYFETKSQSLGLACDSVTSVRFESDYMLLELPEMMRLPNSPIQALLYADGYLHYVTAAEPLVDYLINMEC